MLTQEHVVLTLSSLKVITDGFAIWEDFPFSRLCVITQRRLSPPDMGTQGWGESTCPKMPETF